MATTLTARSLDGVRFPLNGRTARYVGGSNLWGVTDGQGRWLTFDGIAPYTPRGGRSAAEEVAATIVADDAQWIEEMR